MVWWPNGLGVRHLALTCSVAALTAACSQGGGPPSRSIAGGPASINRPIFTEDAYGVSSSARVTTSRNVPKGGGHYKLGSPYRVAGRWYTPREDPNYDRQGVGSWYGDDFHGRRTANGEIFDRYALSAAHPTLPLPSYAYVTNLQNGRTILVRVNDRGPYVAGRIIDLSHASARALGYDNHGHARVRVRYAGRAPLNGDDRRERQFIAEQSWYGGPNRMAASREQPIYAAAPTPPMRDASPDRWSPTAYRAKLVGKPEPAPRPRYQTASIAPPPPAPYYAGSPRQENPADAWSDDSRSARSGRAFVNVGIFNNRANAEQLRRDLGDLGPIEIAPWSNYSGAQTYRVRLGPMSPSQAQVAASEVAGRGVSGTSIDFE